MHSGSALFFILTAKSKFGIFFATSLHVAASCISLAATFLQKSPVRSFRCVSFFAKSHAWLTCSVVNALTTVRCRILLRCPAPSAADSRLAARRPLRQPPLAVSATGGARRRCPSFAKSHASSKQASLSPIFLNKNQSPASLFLLTPQSRKDFAGTQ